MPQNNPAETTSGAELAKAARSQQSDSNSRDSGKSTARPLLERLRLGIRFIVPVIVVLILVPFPRLPIGTGDDSSWTSVLAYAYQHGLQFGRDIVFTYGPLGFLLTPYLCPQAEWFRLITDLVVCSTVVIGVCLWAWQLPRVYRWGVLAVFTFLTANSDPRTELLLYIGLLAWAMLCLQQDRPSLRPLILRLSIFLALAVFASLAKVTFPFVGAFSVAMLSLDLLVQRKSRLAFLLASAFVLCLVLAWIAVGQNP